MGRLSFHHSIIPSIHHSIIPSIHHSIIPSFPLALRPFRPDSIRTPALPSSLFISGGCYPPPFIRCLLSALLKLIPSIHHPIA
jgi:hypothetical protein